MSKYDLRLAGLLCLVVLVLFAGCIPGQTTGANAGKSGSSTQLTREELRTRLSEIESLIRDLDNAVRTGNAELAMELTAAREEISVLKAKIEAQNRWLISIANDDGTFSGSGARSPAGTTTDQGLPVAAGMAANLDDPQDPGSNRANLHPYYQTASESGNGQSTADPGLAADAATNGEEVADDDSTPGEAKRLYDIAYQDLMSQNYQLALLNFRAFLDRHPGTSLSDNAQYWIGEVYYAQRQFNISVEEFRKVIEEFPDQDKVPAAYYKIALCFKEMNDQTTGRRYLGYLIEHHGDTREADLARARLREW
jgi:tol-pal system protein YbgF